MWVTLAIIATVAFLLEMLVMQMLPALNGLVSQTTSNLIDSASVGLIVAPLVAVLVLRRHPRGRGDIGAGIRGRRGRAAAGGVLVLGLAVACLGACLAERSACDMDDARFARISERLNREVQRRFNIFAYGLRGSRGLWPASKSVERGEFAEMVASRDLTRDFPGAMGIGFIRRVKREDLSTFLAATRADGAPEFRITSEGEADELYITEFIEPLKDNLMSQGLDIANDPVRRSAADRAMLTGEPTLTEPITLVQPPGEGPGFLNLLPVYRKHAVTDTPRARREALEGWVYMPILASRTLNGANESVGGEVDFDVFNGTELTPQNLIYSVDGDAGSHTGASNSDDHNLATAKINIGGQTWTITTRVTDKFVRATRAVVWGAGGGGVLMSLLSAWLVLALANTANRARSIADAATSDLRAQTEELERLALVVRETRNLVVITGADGRITWVNPAFEAKTGYTLAEVRGHKPGPLLQFERTDPRKVQHVRELLAAGLPCQFEILNRGKSGNEYWLDVQIQPLAIDPGTGRPSGFIAVESDVTEQVRMREQMRRVTERFDRAVSGSSDALWEYTPSTEEVWYSDRFIEMLGESSQNFPATAASWRDRLHPDDKSRVLAALRDHLVAGAPYDVEYRLRCASGEYRWFRTRGNSERDANGRALVTAGSLCDTTDRKQMEAQMAAAAAALEEAQAIARSGSWSYDLATRKVTWSKQIYRLFGRREADGPPDFAGMLSDYSEQSAMVLDEAVRAAASKGTHYSLVMRTAGKAPDVRYVRGEGRARFDAAGRIVALFGTVTDVTTEVEREMALQEARAVAEAANRAKSEFLANMSHEIRTPMTAILGFADLLADDGDVMKAPQRRREAITTIKRNGQHLLEIINDILDISKIEAGKMTVESIATDPAQIVEDVISLMRVRAEAKGIRLEHTYTSKLPRSFRCDPVRLKQVLVNLVGNAIKFTEVGGVTIRVGSERVDTGHTQVRFDVADTGVGMSDEQAARLFRPFSQADETMARRFGGTGLGLTIARRLTAMLGGDITVKSEQGRGSVFTATIAVDEDSARESNLWVPEARGDRPASVAGLEQTEEGGAKPLQGARLLLAEDGPDNQRLLAFHLRKAGAVVTIVENGRKAIEALTIGGDIESPVRDPAPFDLILMDMQMPEMDGYAATSRLRALNCRVPVIALTAHAMAGDREKCVGAGCDDYATKPIDRKVLIDTCVRWAAWNTNKAPAKPVGKESARA
ncbi:MAG: CHASE domain-containing protein [Planctomycetes bacterium]|nr:CHASE domain-containing protein [Planctomycetota bacterium]